ncbi:unnamed protein product [Cuscuta epithymum]|uniref:DYW domain-containing protein n=1 Tax=Cuscuta epithymum TaxID=186058 RepID=A0AAV0DR44_9ASTE|nr:unnamed protein product [Cuscuta epithymum]
MNQTLLQEPLEPEQLPPPPLPCIRFFSKPRNLLNDHSFEQNYRTTCTLLLSATRSKCLSNGLALHAHTIKSSINTVPLVCHHLINFYSKLQCPFESTLVFAESPVKSPTTWSSVISSLAQNETPGLALQYFRQMMRSGVRPDDHTFPCATKSSAMLSDHHLGGMIHCCSVKTGFDSDVFVGSSLVDMYAKCGQIDVARYVFDEMPEKNVVSWSGMICGYGLVGENDEALRLFKLALEEELNVNDFTYSCVIRLCGTSTLLELGRQIHGICLKTSYDSSSFVGTSLISLYSKCGLVEAAYQVFNEGSVKNLGMWNAMSLACAQHGHTNKVFNLFKQIERAAGIKPNFITFLCVLYACSHAGLTQEGKYYFGLMKDYGIEPGDQHYASFVDCLGRAGKLQEALKVVEEMPIKPTESVWGALLTGCRIHRNTELAAYVADRVFELGPVSPGLHVLLSNTYAAAGRYEDAAKARKMLREQGVKKETGLSWVEEGNRTHMFATGDKRHERYKEIYHKLDELGDEMERAGYVADTNFVLQQVGDQERNEAIRYHSERIAIAFALITIPPERPIRVMKNLRVCGDCHNAIKFMSKCTGRVMIVRDNNRFHRFENGKCTCGDYW